MVITPLAQFAVKPLVRDPLFHIGGYPIFFTNQALIMLIVVVLASALLILAMGKRSMVPSRAQSMAELCYEFVANMIHSTSGEDGFRFFPFIFTLFLFILFCNFLSLAPGSFAVTGQIAVNFSLAAFIIVMVIVTGFMRFGMGFFRLFVPKAPWYVLPLLIPIEIISFFIRPVSLSVRLFANMLAGHTMLAVFAAFIVALGSIGSVLMVSAAAPLFLMIAIMALEFLVAFLQAYVFTMLTCIYLNEALHLHDEH